MNTASENTRMLLHPFGVLLLPIVPIICLLLAKSIGFALICIAVGFVVALTRGPKFFLIAVGAAVGIFALMWVGLAISLPVPPDAPRIVFDWLPGHPSFTVTPAISGALRLAAVSVVYVATIAFLRTRVLADSVITQFGVPYRVVDVLGLGGRFAVLLRQDTNSARLLARLRSRGNRVRSLALASGLTVPVLMSSFRHADELSIAMDSRGFGALPERTIRHAAPFRVRDGVILALVWALAIAVYWFTGR